MNAVPRISTSFMKIRGRKRFDIFTSTPPPSTPLSFFLRLLNTLLHALELVSSYWCKKGGFTCIACIGSNEQQNIRNIDRTEHYACMILHKDKGVFSWVFISHHILLVVKCKCSMMSLPWVILSGIKSS